MTDAATSALSPADVRRDIRDRLLAAEGDRVAAIYLFGSRAKGTARPRSDWDVAIVMRDRVDNWADEAMRIGPLFYGGPFSVDLHIFDVPEFENDRELPGTLARAVVLHGEVLYEHAARSAGELRPRVDQVGR